MNECCKNKENLREVERRPVFYSDGGDAGALVVYECKECHRKHYIHETVPMAVGVRHDET